MRELRGEVAAHSGPAGDVSAFVTDMTEILSQLIEEERANDPSQLKQRIRELERQLADKPAADPAALDQAWTEGFKQGEAETEAKYQERIRDLQHAIDGALGHLLPHAKTEDGVRIVDGAPPRPTVTIEPRQARPRRKHTVAVAAVDMGKRISADGPGPRAPSPAEG